MARHDEAAGEAEETTKLLVSGPDGVEMQTQGASATMSADAPSRTSLVIPVAAPAAPASASPCAASAPAAAMPAAAGPLSAAATAAAPASTPPCSTGKEAVKDASICRICLEEDTMANLEQPCGCTGTQKFAHHACIQRWVEEKGHLRCEVCEQQYKGTFEVPPPPPLVVDSSVHPLFGPMFIRVDNDEAARAAALELYDEQDYQQRHPGMSWGFTLLILVMFLVVLHHTMIVADGDDGDGGMDSGGGMAPGGGAYQPSGPSGGGPSGSDMDDDDYGTSLTLFLLWVGTKVLLIGVPLYTVMRIAARQARREQYEAMLNAAGQLNSADARRMVLRVRAIRHDGGSAGGNPVAASGPNAV